MRTRPTLYKRVTCPRPRRYWLLLQARLSRARVAVCDAITHYCEEAKRREAVDAHAHVSVSVCLGCARRPSSQYFDHQIGEWLRERSSAARERTASMEHSYKVYRSRWLMLVLGCFIVFVVMAVEQPFTPSSINAARYLGVSITAVHWLKYAWSLAAVLGAVPGMILVERQGVRKAGLLFVFSLVLGVAVRLGELGTATSANRRTSNAAYIWLLAGSIVAGIFVVPLLALTTFVAASWFDDGQRGLANTLVRPLP